MRINYSYKQNEDYGMQMTNMLQLQWTGKKGYNEIHHHQSQRLEYNLKLWCSLCFLMCLQQINFEQFYSLHLIHISRTIRKKHFRGKAAVSPNQSITMQTKVTIR